MDDAGTRPDEDLPEPLPYNLKPADVVLTVKELYELLHDLNTRCEERGYERLEELLDPAGFSGLISRAICDGLGKFSRELVVNRYPGGYPDLVPRGTYPRDSAQHGTKGGLEVKASRFQASWQSHSPRAGWFCFVQFDVDRDEDKAVRDRDPTTVKAIMVCRLEEKDWSWARAAEDSRRTATASVEASGRAKMRASAVWVAPDYEARHQELLIGERRKAFSKVATDVVLAELQAAGAAMKTAEVTATLEPKLGVPAALLTSKVTETLRGLARDGHAIRVRPGVYLALGSEGQGGGAAGQESLDL